MPERTSASERKLREAMERLLNGTAVRTDGRLIKENLYREAGVSRATMNRATSVLDEWTRLVAGTQPRDREIEALNQSLSERATQIKKLRARVCELEAQLTIAATAVEKTLPRCSPAGSRMLQRSLSSFHEPVRAAC